MAIDRLKETPPEWDKQPCPYCGARIEYVSNEKIYGRKFGNGMCYKCTKCDAHVGVHGQSKPHKKHPLGILATESMRKSKIRCHKKFDYVWHSGLTSRGKAYKMLAKRLNISEKECHFGWFNLEYLRKSLKIMSQKEWYKDN